MNLKPLLILAIYFFTCLPLFAQTDSIVNNRIEERFYNDMSNLMFHCGTGRYSNLKKTWGIVPEYQLGNEAALLGVFYFKAKYGKWGKYYKGITVNTGFLTKQDMYTSTANVWLCNRFISFFGGAVGTRAIAYWGENRKTTFAIRPEVGISIYNVHIMYGYDFITSKNENQLWHKNNNVTVSCFLPLL